MKIAHDYLGLTHCRAFAKATMCLLLATWAGTVAGEVNSVTDAAAASVAQQKGVTVKGIIKDAGGEPIMGASIVEKNNARNGTISDYDGRY